MRPIAGAQRFDIEHRRRHAERAVAAICNPGGGTAIRSPNEGSAGSAGFQPSIRAIA